MLDFNNRRLTIPISLLFIIIIFYAVFFKGNSDESLKYNTYILKVNDISGVKLNQDISLGGYPVGFVSKIIIDSNYNTSLLIKVDRNFNIAVDSFVSLNNSSLISSRRDINIINGVETEYLENNDVITNSLVGINFNQILDLISQYINS